MAPNRKRLAIQAPEDAWVRLGELLQLRRGELGYRQRPAFCETRNINTRLIADIEHNYRPNTFPRPPSSRSPRHTRLPTSPFAALLRGEADELIRTESSPPPAPAATGSGGRRTSLVTGEDKNAAAWPYAEAIWQRLHELAGNLDPTGAELFGEGTDEARIWDVSSLRQLCSIPERVWMIADLRHREAGSRQMPLGRRACG